VNNELTLGPVLFHWPAEQKRDFYFRIADEAPVDTVYLGEVICSKREPFFKPYLDEVIERLQQAGKRVVFSTLAEIMLVRERRLTEELCAQANTMVEANDSAALNFLRGKAHRIGPFLNVYNEKTLEMLAARGATHFTLPPELPYESLLVLAAVATSLGITLEVQVYGRIGLALSARCYHARAHDRVKDNCGFICEQDPDGMELKTMNGSPFLAINGVQTMSWNYLNLVRELPEMQGLGIGAFRISPHSNDMVATARIFRALLNQDISTDEAMTRLEEEGPSLPYANGFYHGSEGYRWQGQY